MADSSLHPPLQLSSADSTRSLLSPPQSSQSGYHLHLLWKNASHHHPRPQTSHFSSEPFLFLFQAWLTFLAAWPSTFILLFLDWVVFSSCRKGQRGCSRCQGCMIRYQLFPIFFWLVRLNLAHRVIETSEAFWDSFIQPKVFPLSTVFVHLSAKGKLANWTVFLEPNEPWVCQKLTVCIELIGLGVCLEQAVGARLVVCHKHSDCKHFLHGVKKVFCFWENSSLLEEFIQVSPQVNFSSTRVESLSHHSTLISSFRGYEIFSLFSQIIYLPLETSSTIELPPCALKGFIFLQVFLHQGYFSTAVPPFSMKLFPFRESRWGMKIIKGQFWNPPQ